MIHKNEHRVGISIICARFHCWVVMQFLTLTARQLLGGSRAPSEAPIPLSIGHPSEAHVHSWHSRDRPEWSKIIFTLSIRASQQVKMGVQSGLVITRSIVARYRIPRANACNEALKRTLKSNLVPEIVFIRDLSADAPSQWETTLLVTSSLIGWVHMQNDPWNFMSTFGVPGTTKLALWQLTDFGKKENMDRTWNHNRRPIARSLGRAIGRLWWVQYFAEHGRDIPSIHCIFWCFWTFSYLYLCTFSCHYS